MAKRLGNIDIPEKAVNKVIIDTTRFSAINYVVVNIAKRLYIVNVSRYSQHNFHRNIMRIMLSST